MVHALKYQVWYLSCTFKCGGDDDDDDDNDDDDDDNDICCFFFVSLTHV